MCSSRGAARMASAAGFQSVSTSSAGRGAGVLRRGACCLAVGVELERGAHEAADVLAHGDAVDLRRRRRGAAARRPARCSWSRTWPGSRRSRRAASPVSSWRTSSWSPQRTRPPPSSAGDRRARRRRRPRGSRRSSSSTSKRGGGRVDLVGAVVGHRAIQPREHVQVHQAAALVLGDLRRTRRAPARLQRAPASSRPGARARAGGRSSCSATARRACCSTRPRPRSRSTRGTAARRGTDRPRRGPRGTRAARRAGRPARRGAAGSAAAARPGRAARVCTSPKLGAVSVTNTAGCSAIDVRDALAAAQAGGDQVVGVLAVALRARRADRLAAVPARLAQHAVGLGVGRPHAPVAVPVAGLDRARAAGRAARSSRTSAAAPRSAGKSGARGALDEPSSSSGASDRRPRAAVRGSVLATRPVPRRAGSRRAATCWRLDAACARRPGGPSTPAGHARDGARSPTARCPSGSTLAVDACAPRDARRARAAGTGDARGAATVAVHRVRPLAHRRERRGAVGALGALGERVQPARGVAQRVRVEVVAVPAASPTIART